MPSRPSASATAGPPIALILDRTPFYAESGGQVGDTGTIRGPGFVFTVEDTRKDHDFILHPGRVTEGTVNLNAARTAAVDAARRQAIRRAHSATHLLHHALHRHLGKHAQQAGSKVEPDRLRFDFANPEAVGKERLDQIEKTVNALVMTGDPVTWTHMPIAEAKSLGAMALFGEKYPDIVRVVRMGDFSKELCGGTHLDNVGQVGLFKIIGEESVASGTRRITALTGQAALDLVRQEEEVLAQVAATLRVPQSQLGDRVAALVEEIKTLKKQASQRKADTGGKVSVDDLVAGAENVGDATVVVQGRREPDARRDARADRRPAPQGRTGTGGAPDHRRRGQGPARRRPLPRPDRPRPARRQLAQASGPDRRRRRRRPARPGPGRRQDPGEDPRRSRARQEDRHRDAQAVNGLIGGGSFR